jgi:hypothetical protein
MFVAALDLEWLSGLSMDAVDDKNDMVPVPLKVVHREMPRNVVCVAVSLQSEELTGHML